MANKVYQVPETAIVFTESGGDAVFTPKNIANGAGRISTQLDRGTVAKAMRYRWEAQFKGAAAVAIGSGVRVYLHAAHSAAAAVDGGQSDAGISAETQLSNWALVGQVVASTNAVGPFYASGVVTILGRYLSVGLWNASGQTLTNVNGDNKITLVPIPDEIQAST
jgi:hypothetical protein